MFTLFMLLYPDKLVIIIRMVVGSFHTIGTPNVMFFPPACCNKFPTQDLQTECGAYDVSVARFATEIGMVTFLTWSMFYFCFAVVKLL